MSGNMQRIHGISAHASDRPLRDQEILGDRLELDIESVFLEKLAVANHHRGVRVETDAASVAALDFRRVHHMVEMAVREQQPVDLVV